MYRLEEVLINITKFMWSHALFLPEEEVWGGDTLCMVLDPNDVDDDMEEIPKIAKENGMMYALDVQIIQSVVNNVIETKPNWTGTELVEAFLYYYDNDSYMYQ